MDDTNLTPLHGRVLGFFGDRIVGSVDEIAAMLDVDPDVVEQACVDLIRAGLLAALSEN